MKNKITSLEFNLTEDMACELIKFNELKQQLNEKKKILTSDKNDKELLLQIKKLEDNLNLTRKKFIKNFRKNNKEQINKYLELKDHL